MRVPQPGASKVTPSQIGNLLAPCYGFTENVYTLSLSSLYLPLTAPGWIAGSGKSILRCVTPIETRPSRTHMIDKLRDHPGHQIHIQYRVGFPGLFFLRFQGQSKAGLSRFIIIPYYPTLRTIRYILRRSFLLVLLTQARIRTANRRLACGVPQEYAHGHGTSADLCHHGCPRRVSQ